MSEVIHFEVRVEHSIEDLAMNESGERNIQMETR